LLAATRTGITQFVAIFVLIGFLAKIRAIGFGLQAWIPSDKRRLIVIAWVFDTGERLRQRHRSFKLSVSLPDDLVQDLKAAAPDNVSAFVTTAVRHELDRRRLHAFVDELVAELGPSDEAEVARYSELFAATTAVADVDREASS
jgi:post-segregation antitoxin (ccd killing protein)